MYLFIYLFIIFFIYYCYYYHYSFWGHKDISHLFINMVYSPAVCREHVHTGRPHTRIDNGYAYSAGKKFYR